MSAPEYYFTTNDDHIRLLLSLMQVYPKDYPKVSEYTGSRELLTRNIQPDLCREFVSIVDILKTNIIDPSTTVIYAMTGTSIIGMIIFQSMQLMNQRILKINYLCTSNATQGIGKQLINCVKYLANIMRLPLYVQSIHQSATFYTHNGFVDQGSNFYLYEPTPLTHAHAIGSCHAAKSCLEPVPGGSKLNHGKSKRTMSIKIKYRRHSSKSKSKSKSNKNKNRH